MQKVMPMTGSMPKSTTPTPVVRGAGGQGSGRRTLVFAFIGGLILGGFAGWIWFGAQPKDTGGDANANTMEEGTAMEGVGGADTSTVGGGDSMISSGGLLVASPQPSGMQVAVTNVSLAEPTWLVVYESRGGLPGNALGAAMFFPTTKSGTIDLLRGTLPGQTYFVGQSLDDGDHIFSLQSDKPVRDAEGNPVWVTFQTQ